MSMSSVCGVFSLTVYMIIQYTSELYAGVKRQGMCFLSIKGLQQEFSKMTNQPASPLGRIENRKSSNMNLTQMFQGCSQNESHFIK